jgi:DNA recombination-dependent growth factor C
MGLVKGTVSFVLFFVEGRLPDNPLEFIVDRVKSFSFRDIDDTYDEYSPGWVSVHNMFDSGFTYASCVVGDYITLTLRVDERKVAPAILKKFVQKEEERVRIEKELPKLGRAIKVQIKERVRSELIRKALPVPSTYDLCWNLSASTVLFFSTNQKAQAVLEDYFKESFGLLLRQQIPFTTAERLIGDEQLAILDSLSPELFV